MNTKLVRDYLIITFSVMIVFWGGCAVLSQVCDLTIDNPFMKIPYMIGGFSPTIASYVSLKRNHIVGSFQEWIKKIVDLRHPLWIYAVVALFVLIYYLAGCLINGFVFGAPVFMLIVIVPMMVFGGGNEEVGWRMILQPELEKKYGFHRAAILVGAMWWIWHLPLFFIQGTANADMNFWLFGILCLALSYALGTIQKLTNGVFPCIVMHCLINGLSAVFVFEFSLLGCLMTVSGAVLCSLILLKIHHRFVGTSS